MNIILIIVSSLIAPVLVGIILSYIKNIKPVIIYQSVDSIPLQSESRNKNKGVYLVEIMNISSKTIKSVSLFVQLEGTEVKIGGIKGSQGLQYSEDVKNSEVEIKIPFFKGNDELMVSIIAESPISLPNKPEIAIRSPQHFKLQLVRDYVRRKWFINYLLPAIGAIMGILFFNLFFQYSKIHEINPEERKEVLIFAANVNGLYDLSNEFLNQKSVKYFDQGDIIYARAKLANNAQDIKKYSNFLKTILEYEKNMLKISRCVITYNIAKVELILNNKSEAREYLKKAITLDKNFVEKRLKYDVEATNIEK